MGVTLLVPSCTKAFLISLHVSLGLEKSWGDTGEGMQKGKWEQVAWCPEVPTYSPASARTVTPKRAGWEGPRWMEPVIWHVASKTLLSV